jgi:hypothetical protein
MGIQIPGWLRTVADYAVGQHWPDGDETAMRRLADSWFTAAQAVRTLQASGEAAMSTALGALTGQTADAMKSFGQTLDADVGKLHEQCSDAARLLEESAAEIEETKLLIIAALAQLAIELAASAAEDVCTLGMSTAADAAVDAAEVSAARLTVKEIFQNLLKRLFSKQMLGKAEIRVMDIGKDMAKGGLRSAGQEAATEYIRTGHVEWHDVAHAGEQGAIQSGIGDITGGGDSRDEQTALPRMHW